MLTFANAAVLAGLGVLALPPIIHFFSRRRVDEVDWAAMQFLSVSRRTRRKIYFENLLLMLLRMLALGLLVLAFAGPVFSSSLWTRLGCSGGNRDVVLLIDGSASMQLRAAGESAAEVARRWAGQFIAGLRPGDRVAIYQARRGLVPILPQFSDDLAQAANALELLPNPRGSVDWPACVQQALNLLLTARPERDLVMISDGQRQGWADEATRARWELGLGGGPASKPRLWFVNVAPDRPHDPFNLALDPIVADRGVAGSGREVRFRSSLKTTGQGNVPSTVRLFLNGQPEGDIRLEGSGSDPVRSLAFSRRFAPGSHLISLQVEGDDFTADNRQEFALEVLPTIPVLIAAEPEMNRRAEFLRDALAPARDQQPGFLVRIISRADLNAEALERDVRGPNTPPRVLVLFNFPGLSTAENNLVERFLAEGGGVLATLGEAADAAAWNKVCLRGGQGWLPARIIRIVDGETTPMLESFSHPAMQVFQQPLPGGLHTAIFPRRWLVDADAGINGSTGTVAARFMDRSPFLVERGVGRGRVLLAAVPLDNSWGTNLITLPDYVRLAHELMYYLCGARSAERNLLAGQPIIFRPFPPEPPAGVRVETPEGTARTVPVSAWPLYFAETQDAGAYKLTTAGGTVHYFVVHGDQGESMLTPCNPEELKWLAEQIPGLRHLRNPEDFHAAAAGGVQSRDLWWLAILLAMAALLFESLVCRRFSASATSD